MDKLNDTTIDIMEEIENDVFKELNTEKKQSAMLKKAYAEKHNLFYKILEKMFGKLMSKLRIKITLYWNDKELFTYEIPKN